MTNTNSDSNQPHEMNDTRHHILTVGHRLIAQQGFTAVGLSQLLKQAEVPKGSFYHYFASKEAFGEALIEQYFVEYQRRLHLLDEQPVSAQQKIYNYFEQWYNTQQIGCEGEKCLVVKLSAEVADLSEPMRLALHAGYQQVTAWLALQVKAGQLDGSIPQVANISAESIANRWYFAWIGASLIAKVSQSNLPLSEVWQMTTTQLGR